MSRIQELIDQGYTEGEAALVAQVIDTAAADRDKAIRTGVCRCGGKLARRGAVVECSAACGMSFAA